ncbi:Pycsar system effector family protein [Streptomyces poonensis]|uniref:Pycsar system effector family protein n=1 Tax=Streptomyces poonensis TaxID=68255 RepID=UPI0016798726|nr:Pycsar system effector family protein [Streptomyces poonensis]
MALSRELIAHNHAEIGRADGKAAVLLATGGSLLGLLLVRHPPDALWAQWLRWTATATTAMALLLLLAALLPRHGAGAKNSSRILAYYEDVVQADKCAQLSAELLASTSDPYARLFRALTGTSRIARTKNRCVHSAVLMLLPAVAVVSAVPLTGA